MKAVIFLGGVRDSSIDFLKAEVEEADLLVGVDSGANILRELELIPDLVIGDMDSIKPAVLDWCIKKGSEIITYPEEKDETDTELALKTVLERKIDEVVLVTATGNRPDHFYGTLIIMYEYSKLMDIMLKTEDLRIGFVMGDKILEAIPGETWSFMPFGEKIPTVSLYGFKYGLKNKRLNYQQPLGVSNIAISKDPKIIVDIGTVIYFRWLKLKESL